MVGSCQSTYVSALEPKTQKWYSERLPTQQHFRQFFSRNRGPQPLRPPSLLASRLSITNFCHNEGRSPNFGAPVSYIPGAAVREWTAAESPSFLFASFQHPYANLIQNRFVSLRMPFNKPFPPLKATRRRQTFTEPSGRTLYWHG